MLQGMKIRSEDTGDFVLMFLNKVNLGNVSFSTIVLNKISLPNLANYFRTKEEIDK